MGVGYKSFLPFPVELQLKPFTGPSQWEFGTLFKEKRETPRGCSDMGNHPSKRAFNRKDANSYPALIIFYQILIK
jgi:hypothetical protein